MKNRPTCCAPLKFNGAKGRPENLIPGFKARTCEAIARSTGQKCRELAVTASTRCRHHGGKQVLMSKLKNLNPKLVIVHKDSTYRRRHEAALKALGQQC